MKAEGTRQRNSVKPRARGKEIQTRQRSNPARPSPKVKDKGEKNPHNNNGTVAIVVWEFGVCDWGAGIGKGRG